nr:MAG: hypothetical protein [Caudoviricetes sp.]
MGYRSEIAISIDPTVFANAPENVKEAFKEIWETPDREEAERVVFYHDCIKWYSDDPVVATIEDWLHSLDETEYGLVELGEDLSDTRMEGEYWTYGLDFVRKIDF